MSRFKFGDIIENGWAGEGNPRKRGVYLRSFHRSGRMNPGHHVELQHEDGKRSEFLIADDDKLTKVGTIFDPLTSELERLREENETFRIGINRLSDEEEKLAETTDGEEFSLVSLAAQLASVEIANRRLTDALSKVDWWARQRCPCENEDPNPCPLCGASVENLEACKSAENTFPRELLETVRSALTFVGGRS